MKDFFFAILSAISCVREELMQAHEHSDVHRLKTWKERSDSTSSVTVVSERNPSIDSVVHITVFGVSHDPEHQWRTQEFCSEGGGFNNSVEDRGQRERGSGGGSPLVRVS